MSNNKRCLPGIIKAAAAGLLDNAADVRVEAARLLCALDKYGALTDEVRALGTARTLARDGRVTFVDSSLTSLHVCYFRLRFSLVWAVSLFHSFLLIEITS